MGAKRKRTAPAVTVPEPVAISEVSTASAAETEMSNSVETDAVIETTIASETKRQFCFKNPKFEADKLASSSKRPKTWKTLKQIIAAEKSENPDEATYGSIDAPTSFLPAKKYSDISGLPALYCDPETKLRYATAEEYSRIRMLPNDIVAGLLTLRKANNPAT